jgi:hypothetical protein
MLEFIFGSDLRAGFLKLLVFNESRAYKAGELAKKLRVSPASVRSEIRRLQPSGLIVVGEQDGQITVKINSAQSLFPELRALFLKAQVLSEKDFGKKILRLGRVLYAALTGYFTNVPEAKTDVFIVGTINRVKLRRLMRGFQRSIDHDIRYTIMTKKEYQYRNDITDRFLYDILENRKIVLVDRMNK